MDLDGLYEVAVSVLERQRKELAAHGVRIPEGLEVRRGGGMLCYYDREDGHIYLSLPESTDRTAALQILLLRQALGCKTEEEFQKLFYLLLPYTMAHELGHVLRHQYGLFGEDLWKEEQIANLLASALTKRRMAPADRAFVVKQLSASVAQLADQTGLAEGVVNSYGSLLQGLSTQGVIAQEVVRRAEMLGRVFHASPEEMLRLSPHLSPQMVRRMRDREDFISSFNGEYTGNLSRYLCYQLGWMLIGMESPEEHYVEEFARDHLHLDPELLPLPQKRLGAPKEREILALFLCHIRGRANGHDTAARYFYKRYRSVLLELLEQASREQLLHQGLLSEWEAADVDTLELAARVAPPSLRHLFPQSIADYTLGLRYPEEDLVAEVDRRLFGYCIEGRKDAAAANTLLRLSCLERTAILKGAPPEFLLEVSHLLYRVRGYASDPMVCEGSRNDDVYVVESGVVEVERGGRPVVQLGVGDAFGDVAFFTRQPRMATVRARTDVSCLVIRGRDLRILCLRYPSVLMQMARILALQLTGKGGLVGRPSRPLRATSYGPAQ